MEPEMNPNIPRPKARGRGRPRRQTADELTVQAASTPIREAILKRNIQQGTAKELSKRRKTEIAEILR
jgi:hypothetical protein